MIVDRKRYIKRDWEPSVNQIWRKNNRITFANGFGKCIVFNDCRSIKFDETPFPEQYKDKVFSRKETSQLTISTISISDVERTHCIYL